MVNRVGWVSFAGALVLFAACGGEDNDTNVAAKGGTGGLSGAGQGSGGKGAGGGGKSGAGGRGGGASGRGGNAGSPGSSAGEGGSPMGSGGGAGEGGSAAGSAGEGGSAAGSGGEAGLGAESGAGGTAGSSGGGGGSGGSGGNGCSDIQNTAPVAQCLAWTGEPAATGGVVLAGTYHLESVSDDVGGCSGLSIRQTTRISQVTAGSFRMETIGTSGNPVTSTWTLSGTVATSTFECGLVGSDVSWNYSVLNNLALPRLRLTQSGYVYIFVWVSD